MRKWTKRLLIFSLVLFLGGAGCLIAGFVMGITSGDLQNAIIKLPFIDFSNQVIVKGEHIIKLPDFTIEDGISGEGDNSHNDSISRTQSFFAEEVKGIELDLAAFQCTIEETDGDQILLITNDSKNVHARLRDDILKIETDTELIHNNKDKLEIYLPKDLQLREFDLQAGAGNLMINCPINAEEIAMEIGASSVVVNGQMTAEEVSIELGAGIANISYLDADKITVENGVGQTSIGLAGQKESYHVTIESAAGNVKYGEENFAGLADTYENHPKDAEHSIQIESALGEVVISFKEEV